MAGFYKDSRRTDGLRANCKACMLLAGKRNWESNKQQISAQQRKYAAENQEMVSARKSIWGKATRERRLEVSAAWQAKNPGKRREIQRRYEASLSKERRADVARVKYARARMSPEFRMRNAVSRQLRRSLIGGKGGKRLEALLEYSMAELRTHLGRQFTKGMAWENYGEWHIDHIVPQCSLPYQRATDPNFRLAWALTNLRPLWGSENRSKNGKAIFLC